MIGDRPRASSMNLDGGRGTRCESETPPLMHTQTKMMQLSEADFFRNMHKTEDDKPKKGKTLSLSMGNNDKPEDDTLT